MVVLTVVISVLALFVASAALALSHAQHRRDAARRPPPRGTHPARARGRSAQVR
ncbi:hypothetical protein SUDANB121_05806 [Nocardiopsis dassonvillei]